MDFMLDKTDTAFHADEGNHNRKAHVELKYRSYEAGILGELSLKRCYPFRGVKAEKALR